MNRVSSSEGLKWEGLVSDGAQSQNKRVHSGEGDARWPWRMDSGKHWGWTRDVKMLNV